MIIRTPFHSKKKLIKNFSCGNYDDKNGEKILKISDRLFSSNTLSLLSKNNFNLSRNLINLIQKRTPNNGKFNKKHNYRLSSYDKYKYINFFSTAKTPKIITYSTIDETKNKKTKESFINMNDIKTLNKKDSYVFLPGVTTPPSIIKEGEDGEEGGSRKFMQINKILKFSKIKKKEEIKKDLLPMQLGRDYIDFIEKKNKLKFNPNFNSPYIHNMNSNYMIDKNLLNKLKYGYQKLKLKKQIEEDDKLELELKDHMEEMSIDLQNYKKEIKIFLTDETKLNEIYIHEKFFDSYVNKINFLFDDRKFPTIKNNLNKLVLEIKAAGDYEWNRLNMIEISTLTYLHKLKAKIQRELDEIEEENKEKQFMINQQIGKYNINNNNIKIKKKKHRKNENNENEENIDNFDENNSDDEEEIEEKIANKEDLYEFEEFFVHKRRPYKRIDFAVGKLAYTVYHNPKFYIEYFNKRKIVKEDKGIIKKKKEFDLYL